MPVFEFGIPILSDYIHRAISEWIPLIANDCLDMTTLEIQMNEKLFRSFSVKIFGEITDELESKERRQEVFQAMLCKLYKRVGFKWMEEFNPYVIKPDFKEENPSQRIIPEYEEE
jgi:hypothetical protein